MRLVLMISLILNGVLSCAGDSSEKSTDEVTVDFYVTVLADTPADSKLYLSGNIEEMGSWKADGLPLRRTDGEAYHARLKLPRGTEIEYKVTRGSWETVEKGPQGEELHNRTMKADRNSTQRITVSRWASNVDAAPRNQRKSTITGDVRAHDITSKILLNRRKLLVWLPPGYEANPNQRYPVLYMQDGQNLFDEATSFAGEWRADETAGALIENGRIEPIIIVGIENTFLREREYTPIPELAKNGEPGSGGNGDDYLRFLIEEVKPLIDSTYRTKPDRANTAIAGSSLGALISIHAVKTHGERFSRCAALSPSLWWSDGAYLKQITKDASWARDAKIWIDMGTHETSNPLTSHDNIDDCKSLCGALEKAGLEPGRDFVFRSYEGARHNEQAWAQRFGEVLVFLFGK